MNLIEFDDHYFMREALKEAKIAMEEGEIPVGAVIVSNNRIIARAHNQTEILTDSTAHAEMLAITSAFNNLGAKYLTDCSLYVTLEPCIMCSGASYWAQLKKIVFGAHDPKRGFMRFGEDLLHPKTELKVGVEAEESKALLDKFFKEIRKKN